MRNEFELRVIKKLMTIFPESNIKTNKIIKLRDFSMEIDLILELKDKRIAFECKDINKNQFHALSKVIGKLRQLKESGLFDDVILVTSLLLPPLRRKRYIESGITPLDFNSLEELKYKKSSKKDGIIDVILNKHNLSERQLSILLGITKKTLYSYKKHNYIPNDIKTKLDIIKNKNSRDLHYESFLKFMSLDRIIIKEIRNYLKLSQEYLAKRIEVNIWSYQAFECGLENQRYLLPRTYTEIKKICNERGVDFNIIEDGCRKRANVIIGMLNKAKDVKEVITFRFPSRFSYGERFESKVNQLIKRNHPNWYIFNNAIIADANVKKRYEIDILALYKNERILIECRKDLNSSGRNITNLIASIVERKNLLRANKSILFTQCIPTKNEFGRFKKANIELKIFNGPGEN